jgi:hypothetical protein
MHLLLPLIYCVFGFGQTNDVPSFAFYNFLQAEAKEYQAARELIDKAKMKLTRDQEKQLVAKLFADHIPSLDYMAAARYLNLEVSREQRNELIKREKAKKYDPADLSDVEKAILNDSGPLASAPAGAWKSPQKFSVLDIDRDGRPDMIWIPAVYFGPSTGLKFYVNRNGKFEYFYENAGDIRSFESAPGRSLIRFAVAVIDSTETGILLTFLFDHNRRTWEMTKEYYALQTVWPRQWQVTRLAKTKKDAELRTSPSKNGNGPPRTIPDNAATSTLFGNVVARYSKSSGCFILAAQGDWFFVAFTPDAVLLETSLKHDLDDYYYKDGVFTKGRRLEPYLCGWISKDAVD